MLIIKMRDQSGEPVNSIEFMTPHLIVYNTERLEDGTIIDGRFGLVSMMDYYNEAGDMLQFEQVEVEEDCLNFNGNSIKISTDPEETEEKLKRYIKRIPIVTNEELN